MTGLAKILVVFVAAASLGFAAFAGAMRSGGPNWDALANSPEIADKVSIVGSDTGTYTATMRVSGESVGSSNVQAEVVLKAQTRILNDLQSELQALQTEIATNTPLRDTIKQLVEADRAGLERHAAVWADQLQALGQQIAQVTDELTAKGVEAQQLQEQLRELRYEVLRLRNQLELLRDDLFAAAEQKRSLETELLLLRENRSRLQRRQEQLTEQLKGSGYDTAGE